MRFGLSQEQQMLGDMTGRALENGMPLEAVREVVARGAPYDEACWHTLVELGVAGVLIPHNLGGSGLGMVDAMVIAEALGAAVAPVPFLGSAVMAPMAIALGGSDAQRSAWLPPLAAGELVYGVAVSEFVGVRPQTGVELRDGALFGTAQTVLDSGGAHAYLVSDQGGRIYRVPRDTPNLQITRLTSIDKTRSIGCLTFDGVEGEVLPGSANPAVIQRAVEAGRLVLAADTLGAAQTMLDKAVAYAKERRQFNRVIGSFQAVKHMCAEMAASLEPCRAMVWHAAHAMDALPEEAPLLVAHTKAHLAEVGRFVAKTATEVHGGMGFTDLLGLHYWFKRIGVDRQWLGSPEHLREEAAALQGWTPEPMGARPESSTL